MANMFDFDEDLLSQLKTNYHVGPALTEQGGMSTVYPAEKNGNQQYIVKVLGRQGAEKEAEMMQHFNHPNIAALRATTEEMRAHAGADLPCVRGTLKDTVKTKCKVKGPVFQIANSI